MPKPPIYPLTPKMKRREENIISKLKNPKGTAKDEMDLSDEIAQLLFDGGKIDGTYSSGDAKYTAIQIAVINGRDEALKEILDNDKSNIDAVNSETGDTALIWAAKEGRTKVALNLMEYADVNVNAQNAKSGTSPLIEAARGGHKKIVAALLKHRNTDILAVEAALFTAILSNDEKNKAMLPTLLSSENKVGEITALNFIAQPKHARGDLVNQVIEFVVNAGEDAWQKLSHSLRDVMVQQWISKENVDLLKTIVPAHSVEMSSVMTALSNKYANSVSTKDEFLVLKRANSNQAKRPKKTVKFPEREEDLNLYFVEPESSEETPTDVDTDNEEEQGSPSRTIITRSVEALEAQSQSKKQRTK